MTDPTMPPDLARLWRLTPSSPRVGRPAELDVDTVVNAAIELADRDGLAGVTLQKVAATLGFTKMALYRHVGSKNELFELMVDHATGPAPDFGADPTRWREGLRGWAGAIRAKYAERPWLAQVPIAGPPRGPNVIGWMDAFLRVLRDTGLDTGTQIDVLNVVSGYVQHAVALAGQLGEARSDSGLSQEEVEANYGRSLAMLVDPERFPDAARLFAAEVFEPPPEGSADHDFVVGLELILDGVAVAIVEHGGSG